MVEEVKQQHLENDISFLSKQLSVIDPDTARERVYFVSAKEVLTIRSRQKANQSDVGESGCLMTGAPWGAIDEWLHILMLCLWL